MSLLDQCRTHACKRRPLASATHPLPGAPDVRRAAECNPDVERGTQ